MRKLLILAVVFAIALLAFNTVTSQEGGQTIVVMTVEGESIGGPVVDFGPEWEELTGNTIELQQFAFGDLAEKALLSFDTGANEYDVLIFPAPFAGDLMAQGYIAPVPEASLAAIEPDDIIPLYADQITSWGGIVYAFPYDGDAHQLYYRKDLVNPDSIYAAEFEAEYGYPLDEPATWTQYIDIATFFNGREVETAGELAPISGVAEAQRIDGQSYWVFISHAAGYAKVPGEPCFFFNCDDLTPNVNNPGWVRALEEYVSLRDLGPAEMINWDVGNTRIEFPAGCCVFNVDWGDVGPISYDPNASVIIGDTGFAPLPGGEQYWDGALGEWVIPEDGVNEAPFIAFGGWIIMVAADSEVQDAAFSFAEFMTRPELVSQLAVTGGTGINPSRYSQLNDTAPWVAAGFDEEGAADYLDSIINTIGHPNAVLDLRIRGTFEYFGILDIEVNRALEGEISAQEALDNVAEQWDELTDRLGRDNQLDQYRSSVGWSE